MSKINSDIAAQVEFTMRKGDTYDLPFEFTNADASPINMTGCKVLWQFREKSATGKLLQVVTDVDGGEWVTNNKFQPQFIVNMPAGVHYTDFEVTFPTGKVLTFFEGKVTVKQDVSEV